MITANQAEQVAQEAMMGYIRDCKCDTQYPHWSEQSSTYAAAMNPASPAVRTRPPQPIRSPHCEHE